VQFLDTSYVLAGDGSEPVAKVKKDRGIAPGPSVEVSADAEAPATTMRDQDEGEPVT